MSNRKQEYGARWYVRCIDIGFILTLVGIFLQPLLPAGLLLCLVGNVAHKIDSPKRIQSLEGRLQAIPEPH